MNPADLSLSLSLSLSPPWQLARLRRPPCTCTSPPPEQLAFPDHDLTLTCLASGFYPGFVRARWTMDGQEAERRMVTESVPEPGGTDGSYSWSGYLTLTAAQWHAHTRFSCELQHESSTEPVVGTFDRSSCPLS
ncbi:hypothetical protein chiPu_0032321 [Chiloscyllium punctatum]|uniref:Ig-like domain-containing protein n=1 Tax=Chiloscyllium punctatum TaxID=137246 RepID=A0A401TZK0_CHIPU|nr:hypothetical protein [Chiloscyllium punctatum]